MLWLCPSPLYCRLNVTYLINWRNSWVLYRISYVGHFLLQIFLGKCVLVGSSWDVVFFLKCHLCPSRFPIAYWLVLELFGLNVLFSILSQEMRDQLSSFDHIVSSFSVQSPSLWSNVGHYGLLWFPMTSFRNSIQVLLNPRLLLWFLCIQSQEPRVQSSPQFNQIRLSTALSTYTGTC